MTDYRAILKHYWGYDNFRGIQEEIINSIGSGKDTLGLMPTGGGKSITFQVPALAQEGLCLVVTPLIALMKDQVRHLRERGIKATAIYSGMTRDEIVVTLENCIFGNYKFLYISPERLGTELFQTKLRKMHVSFITVDESHCISQWGYDFRPAYLKIHQLRKLLPDVPVLALTATATPEVVADIQKQLHFREENVFRMSFERSNLAYIVRETENKPEQVIHILQRIKGSAIIYVTSRRKTREMATYLQQHDITAEYYHAGLDNAEKDFRQQRWQTGESRVMVATNAFGMGIDKPDVRLVIHTDSPDSPEAYFQEAGRAGRDGKKAYAVLLYNPHDKRMLNKHVSDKFPEKDYIRKVYEHLCYYYQMAVGDGFDCTYEFNMDEFCRNFKHFPVPLHHALQLLSRSGYIDYTGEQESSSRIMFIFRRDELYRIHGLPEETEELLQALLRNYTGVFSDYVIISENDISRKTGLSRQQVYEGLLSLARRRILQYIPGKKTPYVTFTQKRVETERIVIPPEVYEQRKENYARRIKAMLTYMTSRDACRGRMLLDYFGERHTHNCLQCDVCLRKHDSGLPLGEFENLRTKIFRELSDGLPHPAANLMELDNSPNKMKKAYAYLLHCGDIRLQDGRAKLNKKYLSTEIEE